MKPIHGSLNMVILKFGIFFNHISEFYLKPTIALSKNK